uniref:E74-like factor 2 n=1 Tax=Mus musculus TaxID=10090 RepID=V9GXK9_MOUSE
MATSLHEGPTNQLDLLIRAVEASVHSSNAHCTDKTIEAAEALLHMESPTCLRDSRSPGLCLPTCLCPVCMPDIHGCQKRIGSSGTGVPDGCELPCGCWELYPSPGRAASALKH